MKIKGLYTALVTPFNANDSIDKEGLSALVRYQIRGGVDGITVLGTTGESPTLEANERDIVIQTTIDEAQGTIPIMVGCGTNATKTTLAQAMRAESFGASSLLIVVPYYNRPTQEGIYQHFKAVSAEVSIPICVYNIPSRTGQNLETQTLERLAELPNIVSVKEASGNISQMTDVIERVAMKKQGFSVLSGDDSLILPLIALGGHGIISVVSNLLPSFTKKLLVACSTNIEEARALHYQLKPLIQALFIETNPSPVKRMLTLAGLPAGHCRQPLTQLSATNDKKLQEVLQSFFPILQNELLCNEIPSFHK